MNSALYTSLVVSLFAYALMATIAMASAVAIKLIVALLARSTLPVPVVAIPRPPLATPSPAAAAPSEISDDLAVIVAAACTEIVGAHRIVYLSETNRPANWTTELRTRHHLSHVPHR